MWTIDSLIWQCSGVEWSGSNAERAETSAGCEDVSAEWIIVADGLWNRIHFLFLLKLFLENEQHGLFLSLKLPNMHLCSRFAIHVRSFSLTWSRSNSVASSSAWRRKTVAGRAHAVHRGRTHRANSRADRRITSSVTASLSRRHSAEDGGRLLLALAATDALHLVSLSCSRHHVLKNVIIH